MAKTSQHAEQSDQRKRTERLELVDGRLLLLKLGHALNDARGAAHEQLHADRRVALGLIAEAPGGGRAAKGVAVRPRPRDKREARRGRVQVLRVVVGLLKNGCLVLFARLDLVRVQLNVLALLVQTRDGVDKALPVLVGQEACARGAQRNGGEKREKKSAHATQRIAK